MVSSKQALAEAHAAAAARRAARARVAALKAGTAKPTVDATWAKLMQSCADCQQRRRRPRLSRRGAPSRAPPTRCGTPSALRATSARSRGAGRASRSSFCSSRRESTMPPPPPKDEPTPEERKNAQAFAKKATCDAGLGLGGLLLKRGRRGEACEAATALKADEAWRGLDLTGGGLRRDGRGRLYIGNCRACICGRRRSSRRTTTSPSTARRRGVSGGGPGDGG